MHLIGIFAVVIATTLLMPAHLAKTENSFVIESIQDCLTAEDEGDRRCDVRNLTVGVLESGKWGLLGRAYVDLDRLDQVKLEFTKCNSKQEPETCTYFTSYRFEDGCKKLEIGKEIWSSFFENAEPRMLCPIKGAYEFRKSRLAKGLPGLEGYYWKVKTVVRLKMKTVCCALIEASTVQS